MSSYAFFDCVIHSLETLKHMNIDRLVDVLATTRDTGGRLFVLGNGGGAAHASHAAADFRTLCGIEAYSFDNTANLTALTNDLGWEHSAEQWLKASRLSSLDTVMVVSVGGGDAKANVSPNIVRALDYAKQKCAGVIGIVGRDGGYTATVADECIVIPCDEPGLVTPVVEGIQSVLLHLLVSDPLLNTAKPKWESME